MARNRIDVFIVWFVVARHCPYTYAPDLDRDVYAERFTLREAEEVLAEWMANDVPVPEDYVYAFVSLESRYDD